MSSVDSEQFLNGKSKTYTRRGGSGLILLGLAIPEIALAACTKPRPENQSQPITVELRFNRGFLEADLPYGLRQPSTGRLRFFVNQNGLKEGLDRNRKLAAMIDDNRTILGLAASLYPMGTQSLKIELNVGVRHEPKPRDAWVSVITGVNVLDKQELIGEWQNFEFTYANLNGIPLTRNQPQGK